MDELILPPLLNAICCEQPFQTAIEQVRQRKAGAGDLFWSRDQAIANIAIVLEPEVTRDRVIEMLPLTLVALSDCLAVLLPPQVGVGFRDCFHLVVNGGVAGTIRAAISKIDSNTDIPDWLVLELKVGLERTDTDEEPGLQPDITTMDEEGWEDISLNKFIETFARHFLSWLVAWQDDGFGKIARAWKFKSEDKKDPDIMKFIKVTTEYESTG
jgi:BirA family biotin operon repressor/biotin-[acetyl-CoA-carboxylase] ligase